MMETSTLFLGTIALSVLVMATVQVGMIIYGARLAQRVNRLVDQVEKEIKPALTRVNAVSGDVNRVTTLAVAQLERVDQLFAQFAERLTTSCRSPRTPWSRRYARVRRSSRGCAPRWSPCGASLVAGRPARLSGSAMMTRRCSSADGLRPHAGGGIHR